MLKVLSLRTVVGVALGVAVISLGVGLTIDVNGFVENLLAELIGVLLSILLALLIVDRVVEREQARRWDLVSGEILQMLRFALMRAGVDVYLRLPAPRPADADPYTMGLAGEGLLAGAMSKLAARVRKQPRGFVDDDSIDLIRPHLELVRSGVMPQLLAMGKRDLIARLAAVDNAFQDLEHTAWLEERFGSLDQLNESMGDLLEMMGKAVGEIDTELG